MREICSSFGRVCVGTQSELFSEALRLTVAAHAAARRGRFLCALTGGSTPATFYRWCLETDALPPDVVSGTHFTVSDERHVLLDSPDSNFGNAERQLLSPLDVPTDRRLPWMVAWPVAEAAEAYRKAMLLLAGPGRAYDLCFLGMGDDCHTASLFPGTPLLKDDGGLLFGGQEVPGKGWRLTITPSGLRACGTVVVMTLGANKAEALHRVHRGPEDVWNVPSQLLKSCAQRVVWLVDEAAAAKL
ncbi:MAG: 6-phosphogluconolactonase [Verrucomicrobia bacterium]|nr:MAG: 6-phosphogluconolactonase [Verrucomicrobiota bacterium]